jgi:hypothetical protein
MSLTIVSCLLIEILDEGQLESRISELAPPALNFDWVQWTNPFFPPCQSLLPSLPSPTAVL